ncbi:MAG TPA: YCF48-related protein [Candidatus Acidoferrales bacterium]|nr:YCF48-related protein [Candidatus Acidoferrales bacterium]
MRVERFFRAAARLAAAGALTAAVTLVAGCSTKTIVRAKGALFSRVTIAPHADTLTVGGNHLFVATAYDTGGAVVAGAAIAWSSSNTSVCSVGLNGLATAQGEGVALIIASSGGKSDTATVLVYGATTGWFTQTSGTTQNLSGVFFQPDGATGYAVGDAGTLVTTTNAGTSWSPATSGTLSDLASVWFTSTSVGWTVGKAGTVMKTMNGGSSWTQQTNVGTSQNLTCVRFSDALHGWITGAGGLVATTHDGGGTWVRSFPTAQTLNGVSFPDSLNGWAVGNGGVIVGSHDGGTSWYVVQPAVTAIALKGVWRVAGVAFDSLALAVGAQGTVARTGATPDSLAWALGNVGTVNQLNAVQLVDPFTAYAVGASPAGLIEKSVDGGLTWMPQTSNSPVALNGVFFLDDQRGWAVGATGRIVHTSHGGN